MAGLTIANIKKTIRYFKRNGLVAAFYAARERAAKGPYDGYTYTGLSEDELIAQREAGLAYSTKFSVLVPCYETNPVFLREMLLSVHRQTYHNWELILADASASDVVEKTAKEFCAEYTEGRILYHRLPQNRGIAENTNAALAQAKGQYAALLDHDDLYTPDALYEMVRAIAQYSRENGTGSAPLLLYSDEDKTDETGTRFFEPHRKTDFNPDLLLSNNYICHLFVARVDVMKTLLFRSRYDGAQDYDITLRIADQVLRKCKWNLEQASQQIVHIPKVLYHWRCHSASTAGNPDSKQYAYEAGLAAVDGFMEQQNWQTVPEYSAHLGFYRQNYALQDIWTDRPELGAIGGPIIRHGKIAGGAMSRSGEVLYEGLNRHYSGYMNRAVLQQNADALDVRNLYVREELAREFLQTPFISRMPMQDVHEIHSENVRFEPCEAEGVVRFVVEDADTQTISLMLSELIREKGYYLLYDPMQKEK